MHKFGGDNMNIQEKKWKLYNLKERKLLIYGLNTGKITPYDDKLIKKLRTIYDGGIPASILLLSDGMSNGHCYDKALLMSRAFLDTDDDVKLIYATVDSIKLNPKYKNRNDPLYADHCFVERTTPDGKKLIYDTSTGFIYDKKLYWLIEHPKVRKENSKESIIDFIKQDDDIFPEDLEKDKYAVPLILPYIEMTYGRPNEMYSLFGIELLQREIEHFKNTINYDEVCKEIDEDMKKHGLKR